MSEPAPPPAIKLDYTPPRRRRRLILGVVLGVLLIAAIGAGWAYHLSRTPPVHWRSNQQLLAQDNATLVSLADAAERRLLRMTSAEGGIQYGEERTVHMTFDEVNAWLALKFTDWSAYFGMPAIPDVDQPMLASSGDQLTASFKMERQNIEQVISVTLDLQLEDDGPAFVRVDRVHVGELPVPFLATVSRLASPGGDDAEMSQMIQQVIEGHTFDPVFDHPGDARLRLRLTALEVTESGFEATLRAERP